MEPYEEVKQALKTVTSLGYARDRFFVAARRHTKERFDPAKAETQYNHRPEQPAAPLVKFASVVNKTDPKQLPKMLKKLIDSPTPVRSLELEVAEGLALA